METMGKAQMHSGCALARSTDACCWAFPNPFTDICSFPKNPRVVLVKAKLV